MNYLEAAARELDQFEQTLSTATEGRFDVQGVTQRFAVTLMQRVQSTFSAMSLLLKEGHHDETVVLMRRQLEDSMRLHYLAENAADSDALVLGHLRAREKRVARSLDKAINHDQTNEVTREKLKAMASKRHERIRDLDSQISELGVDARPFPDFDEMAASLGRAIDIVPYASASEVSHSGVSAATDGYVTVAQTENGTRISVGLRSEGAGDRLAYARTAINTTSLAMVHGSLLIGRPEIAGALAGVVPEQLNRLQDLELRAREAQVVPPTVQEANDDV